MKKLLMVVSVVALIAMVILNLTYTDGVKPDVVYPMANQHIEWTK